MAQLESYHLPPQPQPIATETAQQPADDDLELLLLALSELLYLSAISDYYITSCPNLSDLLMKYYDVNREIKIEGTTSNRNVVSDFIDFLTFTKPMREVCRFLFRCSQIRLYCAQLKHLHCNKWRRLSS